MKIIKKEINGKIVYIILLITEKDLKICFKDDTCVVEKGVVELTLDKEPVKIYNLDKRTRIVRYKNVETGKEYSVDWYENKLNEILKNCKYDVDDYGDYEFYNTDDEYRYNKFISSYVAIKEKYYEENEVDFVLVKYEKSPHKYLKPVRISVDTKDKIGLFNYEPDIIEMIELAAKKYRFEYSEKKNKYSYCFDKEYKYDYDKLRKYFRINNHYRKLEKSFGRAEYYVTEEEGFVLIEKDEKYIESVFKEEYLKARAKEKEIKKVSYFLNKIEDIIYGVNNIGVKQKYLIDYRVLKDKVYSMKKDLLELVEETRGDNE